jgi:hypothetical protein
MKRKPSLEEKFEAALEQARMLNKLPSYKQLYQLGIPIYQCAHIRNKLIKKGFTGLVSPKAVSEKELIDDLKRIGRIIKRTPGKGDINKFSDYALATFTLHFGSLRAAQKHAGFKPNLVGRPLFFNKDEMLEEMRRLAGLLKRTPNSRDIRTYGIYCTDSYLHYFGSLRNAQKKAGLKPNKRGRPGKIVNHY